MENKKFLRQSDVFTPEDSEDHSVTIVGCGGIGSWSAFIIAKLGVRSIVLYDFDKVEEHNLPSQFFTRKDIGRNKAEALQKNINENTEEIIFKSTGEFIPHDFVNNEILIIAVDSIEARLKICNKICKMPESNRPRIIVDGRMGLEQMEIYVNKTAEEWKQTIPRPGDVDKDPCTARAIPYNTTVIGGIITSIVKKIIKGEEYPKKIIFDLKTYLFIKQ